MATCVAPAEDGGVLLVGYTDSFGSGGNDVHVVKWSPNGSIVWTRTVGGPGNDVGRDAVSVSNGGIVVAGSTDSTGSGGTDMYLVRLDNAGTVLWSKTYGYSGDECALGVAEVNAGGYILCGYAMSESGADRHLYLTRTDDAGVVLWEYLSSNDGTDSANGVISTANGGFLAVGERRLTSDALPTLYVVSLGSDGLMRWDKVLTVEGPRASLRGVDARERSPGEYVVLYDRYFPDSEFEVRYAGIIVYDANGRVLKEESTGLLKRTLEPYGLDIAQSGGLVIAGVAGERGTGCRDAYITTLDNEFHHVAGAPFGNVGEESVVVDIRTCPDGKYVAVGSRRSLEVGSQRDMYLVITDENDLSALEDESNLY